MMHVRTEHDMEDNSWYQAERHQYTTIFFSLSYKNNVGQWILSAYGL